MSEPNVVKKYSPNAEVLTQNQKLEWQERGKEIILITSGTDPQTLDVPMGIWVMPCGEVMFNESIRAASPSEIGVVYMELTTPDGVTIHDQAWESSALR